MLLLRVWVSDKTKDNKGAVKVREQRGKLSEFTPIFLWSCQEEKEESPGVGVWKNGELSQ